MIEIIGLRRIITIAVLAAFAGALAAGSYLYVAPQSLKLQRDLNNVRGQIGTKRSETQRLASEFEQIQEQKTFFNNLRDAGFFSDQNRVVASRRLEEIQKFSRVLATRYQIDSAVQEANATAESIDHVVLDSRINVSIDAIDDIDVMNFVYWVENALPGHVSVRNIKMTRNGDISEGKLRGIGQGQAVIMVQGQVDFNWRTMVPKDSVELQIK